MVKAVTAPARRLITDSVEVRAIPRLLVEWEHNRFSPIQEDSADRLVTVTPDQGNDVEWLTTYDLDSITLPNRPGTGAAKARFSGAKTTPLQSGYRDKLGPRFYLSSPDDPYSYWSSAQKTGTSLSGGGYAFSTPIVLTLLYKSPVAANKLVLGFETSYARPQDYTIEVTTNGTNWTQVPGAAIDAQGRVTVWRKALGGSWSSTPDYADPYVEGDNTKVSQRVARLRGLRLTVNTMNLPNSHLDVIQMGLRLESDLSQFVQQYSKSFEISDRSFIVPLGAASSNTASITLDNIDQFFNNDNTKSLYYGLIGKKAKFTMDLSLDATSMGGSPSELVREFTMWSDSWGGDDQTSSAVALKDSSMFLQEITVPTVFWENVSIGAAIWQMMDILGFTNYNYTRHDLDGGQLIKYFWPDQDATAWEQFSTLAEGTQTAVYFDEYDTMQIKTRSAMFDPAETIDWNLDTNQNGTKLPDIVDIKTEAENVINQVDIRYRPASYSEDEPHGFPRMEVVWEPDVETMTMRSTTLIKDLLASQMELWIRPDEAAYWPFGSLINIRGEVLRYDAKEYTYNKKTGGTATVWVDSQEKKDDYDSADYSNPSLKYANKFTGRLRIKERGLYGSGKADHKLKSSTSYSGMITDVRGYGAPWMGGFSQKDGYLQLSTPAGSDGRRYFLARHESGINPLVNTQGNYWMFGTRMRFRRLGSTHCAGIWFDGDAFDSGYYLQLQTTEHTDKNEKRTWRNELSLTSKKNPTQLFEKLISKGTELAVVAERWYSVDVLFYQSPGGVTETVSAFIDGQLAAMWSVPSTLRPTVPDNRFGLFTRWNTVVDFEYLYGVGAAPANENDTSSFWDLKEGSFSSGYIEREWKYGTHLGNPYYRGRYYPQQASRSSYAFDEFGPVVHELRLIDAQFDEKFIPVQHSNLYSTNTRIAVLSYNSGPFGAQVLMANASRVNEIAVGEDTLTFGPEDPVDHKVFIYGRALYQEDDVKLPFSDEDSIRKNGTISLTFDNRFIQTEDAANKLGEWVVKLWKGGSDELSVEIFGNPLLQLGDLVTVNDPLKGMTPATHQYFVVAIESSFSNGLTTKLTLRRARGG